MQDAPAVQAPPAEHEDPFEGIETIAASKPAVEGRTDETTMTITSEHGTVETTLGALEEAAKKATGNNGLFDADEFVNPALKIETDQGEHVDDIVVKVTATFKLDRKSPEACELFRALTLGRPAVITLKTDVAGEATKTRESEEKGQVIAMERVLRGRRLDTIKIAGEEHTL